MLCLYCQAQTLQSALPTQGGGASLLSLCLWTQDVSGHSTEMNSRRSLLLHTAAFPNCSLMHRGGIAMRLLKLKALSWVGLFQTLGTVQAVCSFGSRIFIKFGKVRYFNPINIAVFFHFNFPSIILLFPMLDGFEMSPGIFGTYLRGNGVGIFDLHVMGYVYVVFRHSGQSLTINSHPGIGMASRNIPVAHGADSSCIRHKGAEPEVIYECVSQRPAP